MSATITDTRITKFCALVNAGMEAWVQAGALLCEMVRDDPLVVTRILRDNPHLTREVLDAFQRIGRKEVLPILMVDGSPGARRLAGLPYEDQARIYAGTVRVVRRTRAGVVERSCRVPDLTAGEAALVFDLDRVRSVKEQRAMLKPAPVNHHYSPRETDPDEAPKVETPPQDGPRGALSRALDAAHLGLMQSRTALCEIEPESAHDNQITIALGAVGKLRFALNDGQI